MTLTARAGIVLDESPQDAPPAKPMDVPKPKDGSRSSPAPGDKTRLRPISCTSSTTTRSTARSSAFDKSGIHWQSLESKDPISFQTSNLSEVKLDSHRPLGQRDRRQTRR